MINFRVRQDGCSYNEYLKNQLSETIGKEIDKKNKEIDKARKAELKKLNKTLNRNIPPRPKDKVKKI
jgi:ribosomal protein S3AE